MSNSNRDLLRHFLATLAYRGRKAITGAPADFANFEGAGKSPAKILSHMGDLIAWSITLFGEEKWEPAKATDDWDKNVGRFFSLLQELDRLLASGAPVRCYSEERMLQGPLSDAMTHIPSPR